MPFCLDSVFKKVDGPVPFLLSRHYFNKCPRSFRTCLANGCCPQLSALIALPFTGTQIWFLFPYIFIYYTQASDKHPASSHPPSFLSSVDRCGGPCVRVRRNQNAKQSLSVDPWKLTRSILHLLSALAKVNQIDGLGGIFSSPFVL